MLNNKKQLITFYASPQEAAFLVLHSSKLKTNPGNCSDYNILRILIYCEQLIYNLSSKQ